MAMDSRLSELMAEALSLPETQRELLAYRLWESLLPAKDDTDLMVEIRRHADELAQGKVKGRTHEEVMKAARDAVR